MKVQAEAFSCKIAKQQGFWYVLDLTTSSSILLCTFLPTIFKVVPCMSGSQGNIDYSFVSVIRMIADWCWLRWCCFHIMHIIFFLLLQFLFLFLFKVFLFLFFFLLLVYYCCLFTTHFMLNMFKLGITSVFIERTFNTLPKVVFLLWCIYHFQKKGYWCFKTA